MKTKIAIDIYNSDFGYQSVLKGVYLYANKHPETQLIICGDKKDITHYQESFPPNVVIEQGLNTILNTDSPLDFRRKNDSSLMMGIKLLRAGGADALISATNSGLYLAATAFSLSFNLPNIRPSFCAIIPRGDHKYFILTDCGASLRLREDHYLNMGLLAKDYFVSQFNVENPKIALLNVGTEPNKGLPETQNAYRLFSKDKRFNFSGNIEPRDVLISDVDIVIADGLSGNIFLKTLEGSFSFLKNILKSVVFSNVKNKIGGALLKKSLSNKLKTFDFVNIPGAIILGITKPCFKLHGASNHSTYYNSLVFVEKYLKQRESAIEKQKRQHINSKNDNHTINIINRQAVKITPLLDQYNIKPRNINLYVKALTHISWSKERNKEYRDFNYERLEHTGDKTINYYVTRHLDKMFPDLNQGDITKINARIISNKNLAIVANYMKLNDFIMLGKSVGDRSKLSDKIWASFFEGFVGAINVDIGDSLETQGIINNIINKIIMPLAKRDKLLVENKDFKTQLQEYVKKIDKTAVIQYKTISITETPNGHMFTEALIIKNKIIKTATGYKKQDIHQKIAEEYLHRLHILYEKKMEQK